MMTPAQCRAARGWLNWTQSELARRTGVSVSTVCDFEKERRSLRTDLIEKMEAVLREAGIQFVFSRAGAALGIEVSPQ